jgi:hypothetical protein
LQHSCLSECSHTGSNPEGGKNKKKLVAFAR